MPNAYIIAGPNGAGKTTFAREFLPNYAHCKNFVNADLIAGGISPLDPDAAAFRAGRLMVEEIRSLASRHLISDSNPRCPAGHTCNLFGS